MGRRSSKPTVALPVPRIKEWRLARGLTQESLAERAGASYHTLQRIEQRPHRRPHPTTLRKLAEALEVPPSRLYFPPEVSGGADKPARAELATKADVADAFSEGGLQIIGNR